MIHARLIVPLTSTLSGFNWNVYTLKELDMMENSYTPGIIMLSNKSVVTGDVDDTDTYELYTVDQMRVYVDGLHHPRHPLVGDHFSFSDGSQVQ